MCLLCSTYIVIVCNNTYLLLNGSEYRLYTVPYYVLQNHCREGQFGHRSMKQTDFCGPMYDLILGCCKGKDRFLYTLRKYIFSALILFNCILNKRSFLHLRTIVHGFILLLYEDLRWRLCVSTCWLAANKP